MPVTRPAPPVTIAYAEINDDCGVTIGLTLTQRSTSDRVHRDLTPAEAFHLADELRDAATEAAAITAAKETS